MLYLFYAIFVIASMSHATPLLWRGAKTIPAGKPIIMVGFGYTTINRSWDQANEEWIDKPDSLQTTVIDAHFMLGYAPINKWEIMAHIPVMNKSQGDLSSLGLQDIWIKTRYNFLGGKGQPFLTGVAAVRIPMADENADIVLDDRTLDIAAGAIFMHSVTPLVFHLKAGYWYNMKNDAEVDIGDEIEAIFKIDYILNNQITAFLNFSFLEGLKNKAEDGTESGGKRRLNLIPGIVIKPAPGLSIRPKFIFPIPVTAVNQLGSNFTWKIGLDVWFVPK